MRKVFLDDLPRKPYRGKDIINWNESIGYSVKFIYDEYFGEIIIDKIKSKRKMSVIYNNKEFDTDIYHFSDAHLEKILGKITKYFRAEVGETFINNKRNLTIIDREYRKSPKTNNVSKHYKYKCNICGWSEGWIIEKQLLTDELGCACCSGHQTIEGINDIPTTDPWMIPYFQGGYNEAKLYSRQSSKTIYPVCPDCGDIKDKPVYVCNLNRTRSIGCKCSDKISYPEKFIISLLKQVVESYTYQLSSKNLKWCGNYRYDFAILDKSCIIETHGLQHYRKNTNFIMSLGEVQENDIIKERLAKENNIKHYIVLDCRNSELEWIKKSVMESKLPTLLNFKEEDIDWIECEKDALSNVVKKVCLYKQNNPLITTNELSNMFKLSTVTILTYLKKGTLIGWCKYDKKQEALLRKRVSWNKGKGKRVEVFNNKESVGVFSTVKELSNKSKEVFNVDLQVGRIYDTLNGRTKQYKGFTFKYILN